MLKISNLFKKKDKTGKKMSKKSKVIISIVVLAVLVGGFFTVKGLTVKKTSATVNTTKVARGNVEVAISGTGTIEANEQYEITSLVKGTVLTDNFQEGDILSKDDVMYTIDTSDMENSIEKSKNSLSKSELTYKQNQEDIANLNITAPISGVITNVYVSKGDNISNNAKVVEITDNSVMMLKIPFNYNDVQSLYVGCTATVALENSSYQLTGKISRIASGSITSDEGVQVTTVNIEVNNPGAVKSGDKATATANGVACNSAGTFEENDKKTVLAKTSGELTWISVELGDKVNAGQKIAQLESDNLVNSQKTNQLSVKDASLSLDNLYEQLEDYTIRAPISGTVVSKTTKAGDKLDSSNTKTVMAIIADMSKMLFKINVDELDIAKIKLGQEVSITAEALEDKTFTGYVDYISIVGTTTNGVTTYPVTVVVNNPEGLIPGMNVDAKIVVESKQDVLTIPVSALNRGNIVYVKDNSPSKGEGSKQQGQENQSNRPNQSGQQGQRTQTQTSQSTKTQNGNNTGFKANIPEGYRIARVQVGLNNNDVVEIVSGLNEGDEVLIPQTASSSTTQQNMQMRMGPVGGGAPSGGQSGGGNYRTNTSGGTNRTTQSGGGAASGGAR